MNSQYNKTFPNLSIFHPCPTHSTQQPDCTALADFQSLKALHINQIEGGVGAGVGGGTPQSFTSVRSKARGTA